MSDVKVKVNDNGPLAITGDIELLDGEGNRIETKKATYLCRCGLSDKKPFCDGAHSGKLESTIRAK